MYNGASETSVEVHIDASSKVLDTVFLKKYAYAKEFNLILFYSKKTIVYNRITQVHIMKCMLS